MNETQRCVEILSRDNVTILKLEGEIDIYTPTDFKDAMLQSLGGSLAVVCGSSIEKLLRMTGLHKVFALYATRDEALQALFGDRESPGAAPATNVP
jgi:anti-anti-sigma regulatory factor